MLLWDVNNVVSRRAWARNSGAIEAINHAMKNNPNLKVTVPYLTDDAIFDDMIG